MTLPPDRVAAFEADIATSPEALARLLDGWVDPGLGPRVRSAFTGLGSSRFAALVVSAAIRARGGTAWVEHASSTTPMAPADDLVLFAISASGRTPEVVGAAERHAGRSLVVAVTNDPDAALAGSAGVVLPLAAGQEVSGIACRTFRATLAALGLATGVVTVDDLRPAVDAIETRLAKADTWAPPIVEAFDRAGSIDVLADAARLGLAEQAALMLREAPRLPAHAWETGDWLHVGVYLALPGHRALLYPGSAADDEVVATIERRGGRIERVKPIEAVGDAGPSGPLVASLVDSVVAEVVAARLWARTNATDKRP